MIFSSYSHDVAMIFHKFSVILGLQLIDIPMIDDMSIWSFHTRLILDGGLPTPLKNMSSSVGMMKFPYGKS